MVKNWCDILLFMIAKQEFINSSEPATKGDLEELREDLQADMVQMEGRLDQKLEAILKVVEDTNTNVSHLSRQLEGLPERVTTLEDDVLKLKAKVH